MNAKSKGLLVSESLPGVELGPVVTLVEESQAENPLRKNEADQVADSTTVISSHINVIFELCTVDCHYSSSSVKKF